MPLFFGAAEGRPRFDCPGKAHHAGDVKVEKRRVVAVVTSLWLIVAAAVVCRVGYAYQQSREIPARVLASVPFEQEAGNIAMALATGKGFSSPMRRDTGPTAWLTPVYPLIIAGIFFVFGVSTLHAFYAAAALNILFSAATCVPIYFTGRRIAGIGAASIAAWLWALFPNAIVIPFQWIWDTSLSALPAATILWATFALIESEKLRGWCAYGFLWGFALLTNPALGAVLPFLLGWMVLRGPRESTLRWKRGALAVGVAALCCVPWTIRNYVAFHRWIPLRSNFPFELWLGNNDIFDEHARNGRKSITRTEEARRYAQVGETAYMAEKWELAIAFIESHPGLELRLTGRKFVDFWMGTEAPVKNFRETDSWLIRGILLSSFLTAIGAFLGIAALWGGRKRITQRRR